MYEAIPLQRCKLSPDRVIGDADGLGHLLYGEGGVIPAIKNPELKAFVEKVGPAFLGHLEAAKQLQKGLTA